MRRLADAWKGPLTKGRFAYAERIFANGCSPVHYDGGGFVVGWDPWSDGRPILFDLWSARPGGER